MKIHSLSLGKIQLECMIPHNWDIFPHRIFPTSKGRSYIKPISLTLVKPYLKRGPRCQPVARTSPGSLASLCELHTPTVRDRGAGWSPACIPTEARSAALPMAQGLLPLGRCRGLLLTLHSLPRRHWQRRRRGGRGGAAAGGCRRVRACLARLEAAQRPQVGRGVRRAASTLARARLVGWEPGGMGAC